MRTIFFYILYCLPVFTYCQEFTPAFRNQIKFSPLRLIDPQPGVELSYERIHLVRFMDVQYTSSQLAVAYLNNFFHSGESRIPRGVRVSLEEKFFLPFVKEQPLFLALETVYLHGRYTDITAKQDPVNQTRLLDTVSVTKQTASLNFKVGIQLVFHPVIIEIAGGLGVRGRYIRYADKSYPDFPNAPEPPNGPWGYDPARTREGNSTTVSVPLNIKVGFVF